MKGQSNNLVSNKNLGETTESLSSYVLHLAWVVWYKTDKVVANRDITVAIDDLLEQNKVFFQCEVEQLSEQQLNSSAHLPMA